MPMSSGVRKGSITIGCSLLVLTLISMICGSVAMSKLTSPPAVSLGLWGLYFAIPGVLSGYKKQSSLLAVAPNTHVLGIVLGVVGLCFGGTFWTAIQDSKCADSYYYAYKYNNNNNYFRPTIKRDGYCSCSRDDIYGERKYPVDCSDLKIVRECTGAVTIIFALCAILTFVGSIYGCIGTCCAPREPTVVVTTAQQPNTVVMTTQAYPAAYPTAYPGYSQQPPPYGQPAGQIEMPVVDDN